MDSFLPGSKTFHGSLLPTEQSPPAPAWHLRSKITSLVSLRHSPFEKDLSFDASSISLTSLALLQAPGSYGQLAIGPLLRHLVLTSGQTCSSSAFPTSTDAPLGSPNRVLGTTNQSSRQHHQFFPFPYEISCFLLLVLLLQ